MKKLFSSIYLPVFLFCLLTATGCKKDDHSLIPEPNENQCLITKITYSGVDSIVYQYDSQKRLKKAEYAGNGLHEEQYFKEYTYDTKERIVKETFKSTDGVIYAYFEYAYAANNLISNIGFYSINEPDESFTHQYNKIVEYTDNKLVSKVATYQPDNMEKPFRFDVYSYDASGNVVQIKEYANTISGEINDVTSDYTYDNKKNPYLYATYLGIGADVFSKNNVLTEKITYHLSGLTKNYTSTYLYNEQGYPVKQTLITGTHTAEIEREYTCAN